MFGLVTSRSPVSPSRTLAPLALLAVLAAPASAQIRVDASIRSSSGSCVGCDLSQKSMTRLRLVDADFSGSNFYRSNLSGGRFDGTNLSGAVFSKAYLIKAEGSRVDLTNAVLRDATLTGASLRESRFASADLRRADLTRGTFTGSDFHKADMSSAIARGADFSGADLSGARLPMANLSETDLTDAVLSGVRAAEVTFTDATMSGARIDGADLRSAEGLTQEQLDTACGDALTRLPVGLSVPYCEDGVLSAEAVVSQTDHDHARAVQRLDSAIAEVETLIAGDELTPAHKRKLQRVHSQLVGSRREMR